LDTNNDGELSYRELVAAISGENYHADSYRVYTISEKVNFLMNRYDTDKNGSLGYAEVKSFLVELGYLNPSFNDVNAIISLIDTNRDSKISWMELYNIIQQ
jgi:Ca2+-binding EF-hand superfamily protein